MMDALKKIFLRIAPYILWGYLGWYLFIVNYLLWIDFQQEKLDIRPWITACFISLLVGVAFLANAYGSKNTSVKMSRGQIGKLFFIPFCVSSYSSLTKGKGFLIIFPPDSILLLSGFGFALMMVSIRIFLSWSQHSKAEQV